MTGFVDKVAILRDRLRELRTERSRYASGADTIPHLEGERPEDQLPTVIASLDRKIRETMAEIILLGGDPD